MSNKTMTKGFDPLKDIRFLHEQLFLTKQALFSARSVREIKALQDRINFLMKKIKELNKK
ncbi:MAG: hypothetical protein QXQ18_02265 [Candidatus Aenigmatarchaeota archaeon]